MDEMSKLLPSVVPGGEQLVICHGDFRLENMILHPTEVGQEFVQPIISLLLMRIPPSFPLSPSLPFLFSFLLLPTAARCGCAGLGADIHW